MKEQHNSPPLHHPISPTLWQPGHFAWLFVFTVTILFNACTLGVPTPTPTTTPQVSSSTSPELPTTPAPHLPITPPSLLLASPTPILPTPLSPLPTSPTETPEQRQQVRFAVIGDYGHAGSYEEEVANLVKSWGVDLIITTGDNNYPEGRAETIDENIGQYYHQFIFPYLGQYGEGANENRFFPSLGNHDWNSSGAQPYLDYFTLPGNERYYDFTWGPVHFFALDSDSREPDGVGVSSIQAAWLQERLSASTAAWKIVYMHHPPYSSGRYGPIEWMQWPFQEWGATTVLAGHEHLYERFILDGFPYINNGLGGYSNRYSFGSIKEGSTVRYRDDHGAMLVLASDEQITFQFITHVGEVVDSYTIGSPKAAEKPTSVHVLPDPTAYQWDLLLGGLNKPTGLTHAGDGSGRLFLLEQAGLIHIVQDGVLLPTPFLDIRDRVTSLNAGYDERGLLGLAFHPLYPENGNFYVNYTDKRGDTVIACFRVSADPDLAHPSTEMLLLQVSQPYGNHNGGHLTFGPDGYLYLGLGDGGSAGDPEGNAQNPNTLMGKILRIDVEHGDTYTVPLGNPFVSGGGLAEIWAWGLRNPWRFSFDQLTGDLYIGDVGQNTWEEINFLPVDNPVGANFGWDYREGLHSFEGTPPAGLDLVEPVAEYDHSLGCSVTGGIVYRGSMPAWQGVYLYGDYCTGRVWGLLHQADGSWANALLFDTSAQITSFGENEDGEAYLVDHGGSIYQLRP